MGKFLGLSARVLMALIFFVSVIFIINNIYNTPNGYSLYQDLLGARGIPGIFAPISILVQLIAGFTLIIGYKIKITAYVLSIYSFIWALIYFMNALGGQPLLLMSLQYLAISGGLLYLAINPDTGYSIDSCKKNK
ncbi:DoxX family protein [Methylophilaceae bacterium]|nr:DoxX family protein [Nitrosomonadales bacterium]MBT6232091.1 DoxX family protein [Nitrosomonadales bacterium]MCH9770931.1 DoxX family protein [Betaproteobacteria bacterium]MDA9086619.1 DoxX family protein [Methylophilaceae bacterium]MDB2679392.1 DoxX family protein [Methylophilaceae bacterium]